MKDILKIELDGFDEVVKDLNKLEKKHLPTALKDGINITAQDVKKAEIKKMKRVFDKPTRFTLNSIYIIPARKGFYFAFVGVKGDQDSYLSPQIYGGRRRLKRSEASLQRRHKMTKGLHIVPGRAIKLNKFGNITRGKMTQIMSVVGGHYDKSQNTTERSKKRNRALPNLFVANRWNRRTRHLQPGIYQRVGRQIKLILIYAKESKYVVRFKFFDVAQKVIDKKLVTNVIGALNSLMKRM